MRLWSLHPQYLDRQGLLALWREALLAQKVLSTITGGYQKHPQLHRFRASAAPEAAIASYLREIAREGQHRGYLFDEKKIGAANAGFRLEVTTGQVAYEWAHLLDKLRVRNPALAVAHEAVTVPLSHPLFRIVPGPVAEWERPRS